LIHVIWLSISYRPLCLVLISMSNTGPARK
jgi:hypothetical protein